MYIYRKSVHSSLLYYVCDVTVSARITLELYSSAVSELGIKNTQIIRNIHWGGYGTIRS